MAKSTIDERIKRLEAHLKQENPVLAGAVQSFQKLDRISRKLGLSSVEESYAAQVSWWPVIAILGTFSAGKSSFINQYTGQVLQRTGNQAIDDKFSVICYGPDDTPQVLPGLALDSDPRLPFYQISGDIESVAEGEGRRVDSYLQLKTCKSEALRGKIFIDSPGFDADQQRTSTLLITNHIIGLSDLVLVFFDARHPEPGAMGDTLQHLVSDTISRPDSSKFLYILNQIDTTAREDNPEEVVGAWQRAMAQHGLTAGRFYRIYSRDAALPIENPEVRERLERKRDEDLTDIESRIHQVEVERAYRIIGVLEQNAKELRDVLVPHIAAARRLWRKRTLWLNLAVFVPLVSLFLAWSINAGYWQEAVFTPLTSFNEITQAIIVAVALLLVGYLYGSLRSLAGRWVLRTLNRDTSLGENQEAVIRAFKANLKAWWRSAASTRPRGWTRRSRRQIEALLRDADNFVQALNDRYAKPSGPPGGAKALARATSPAPQATPESPAA